MNLDGEIIDSKCYLGVMKPGAGKVHRACAALCLLGGIPPLFAVKTEDGSRYGYVLTLADGGAAGRILAGQVAVPVSMQGELERRGDLVYLRANPGETALLSGPALSQFGDTLAVSADTGEFCGILQES